MGTSPVLLGLTLITLLLALALRARLVAAAKLAPQIIERIAYKRTVEIFAEQLREHGVQAQLKSKYPPAKPGALLVSASKAP